MSAATQKVNMIIAMANELIKEATKLRKELEGGNPSVPPKGGQKVPKSVLRRNARLIANRPSNK